MHFLLHFTLACAAWRLRKSCLIEFVPTNFFSASKTYLGWLRNQFLAFGDAFARVRAVLLEGSCEEPSCATWLPDEISAPTWPEIRLFQKSSELESFQTLELGIPFGSSKSSSAVNLMKKNDLVDFRMISHGERLGANAAKTAFFGCRSSLKHLVNFLSKCVENSRFFIFRKSKPKTPSYFKMSKNTRSEPILSSET